MTVGAGRYDHLLDMALDIVKDAQGGLLLMLDDQGWRNSIRLMEPDALFELPDVLRKLADDLEANAKNNAEEITQGETP